jgi:hypothetical protein
VDASYQKVCSRCQRAKDTTEFHRRARAKDGLQAWCKECSRAAVAAHQKADPEAYRDYHRKYRAEKPDLGRRTSRRHYRKHRLREIARVSRWRKLNAEFVNAYERLWRKANGKNTEYWRNRRAARKAAPTIPFTAEQLRAKVQYWGHKCWICGGSYEAIDHVKPLTKGGIHAVCNLRPVCNSCNSQKRNKWPFRPAFRRR